MDGVKKEFTFNTYQFVAFTDSKIRRNDVTFNIDDC